MHSPPLALPRVCVAVAGASLPSLLAQAREALAHTPFIELRLDALPLDALASATVTQLLAQLAGEHPAARLLATCRTLLAGGQFAGSEERECAILLAAAEGGACLADLAIESARILGAPAVASFRGALHARGARLLLSAHDFAHTSALAETHAEALLYSPDLIKLVSTAESLADNLAIRRLLAAPSPVPVVAMAMGEAGLPSRVLGPAWGSVFTFASAAPGGETAPGQVTARALRELYRMEELTPATQVFAVAGDPVAHSLSPRMHSAAFRALGVDAILLPLRTGSPADLPELTRALPLGGLAVTMPLKTGILPLLDRVDPLAAQVGAVNTVARSADGTLVGYNTDVSGVLEPLSARLSLPGARVLVLGAGGAARAAVFALLHAGARVSILNRTRASAEALAGDAHRVGGAGSVTVLDALPRETLFDALVQATPAGMGSSASLPAGIDPGEPLPASLVFEMVYHPLRTPLLALAEAQGIPGIDGLEMFTAQGARQTELWTGAPAPRAAMRAAIEAALAERDASIATPATSASTRTQGAHSDEQIRSR